MKKTLLAILVAATFPVIAAELPTIEAERVQAAIESLKAQGLSEKITPEIKEGILRSLQATEVLKNAALEAGLQNKDIVKNNWKNFEARFYAEQYIRHLKDKINITDTQLRTFYDRRTREVKIQIASFSSSDEANAAKEKLLKGLSFVDLVASLPNQDPVPDDFLKVRELPPVFATTIDAMDKGKISDKAIEFSGKYYLLKVADVRKVKSEMSFEQAKPYLLEEYRTQKVDEQVQALLSEYGDQLIF